MATKAQDSSNTKDLKMAKAHFKKKGILMPWEEGYGISDEKLKQQEAATKQVNDREINALEEAKAELNAKIGNKNKAKAEGKDQE